MPDESHRQLVADQYKTSANLDVRIALHERFRTNPIKFHHWLFDQFELPPRARVLELGCGTGQLWAMNAARVSPDWRLTLSDASPAMLDKTRQATAGLACAVDYQVIDVTDIRLEAGSFDAVIANHMLYYLPSPADRATALAGIRRVLRPDGRFYASTNSLNTMSELQQLVTDYDPELKFMADIVRNFSLENGPEQVAAWFADVAVQRYEDVLVVDDVQMLIDYTLSSSHMFKLSEETKAGLGQFMRRAFEAMGSTMRITKTMGVVCGRAKD